MDSEIRNVLFRNTSEKSAEKIMNLLRITRKSAKKGEQILMAGTVRHECCVIISGSMEVVFYAGDGTRIILYTLKEGELAGEPAMLCDEPLHFSVAALEDTSYYSLDLSCILWPRSPLDFEIQRKLLISLSKSVYRLQDKIHLLSLPSLRHKVYHYLLYYRKADTEAAFTIPLDRNNLAIYLNVDRAALSRELSAMKKDGLIDYRKNVFKILGPLS